MSGNEWRVSGNEWRVSAPPRGPASVRASHLLRDDVLASRMLRQPPLDIEHHPVHDDPAAAARVMLDNLRPAEDAQPRGKVAEHAVALLDERAVPQLGADGPELLRRCDVERRLVCAHRGLEVEQHLVERERVHRDVQVEHVARRVRRACTERVPHRAVERDARLQKGGVRGKPFAVVTHESHLAFARRGAERVDARASVVGAAQLKARAQLAVPIERARAEGRLEPADEHKRLGAHNAAPHVRRRDAFPLVVGRGGLAAAVGQHVCYA